MDDRGRAGRGRFEGRWQPLARANGDRMMTKTSPGLSMTGKALEWVKYAPLKLELFHMVEALLCPTLAKRQENLTVTCIRKGRPGARPPA